MAVSSVVEVTDQTFEEEVLQSSQPVLVDFSAEEWCPPCQKLAPTLAQIATEYAGRVKVAKIDTDSNHDAAVKYNVMSLPTVILFKNGHVVQQTVGLRDKSYFVEMLEAAK